jgi:hypothetical protein
MTFIEITADKFHEFIIESLPKHHASQSLIDELSYHKFHTMNSFKKNFINEILNNYYGIHYVGCELGTGNLNYKLSVLDKTLCTYFLLKYGN